MQQHDCSQESAGIYPQQRLNQVYSFFAFSPAPPSLRGIVPSLGCGGIFPRRVVRFLINNHAMILAWSCGTRPVSNRPSARYGSYHSVSGAHSVCSGRVVVDNHADCPTVAIDGLMGTRIVVVIFEVNVLADAYRRVSIVTLVTVGPSQFAHFVLLVLVFLIQGLSLSLYIIYHNPVTVSTTICGFKSHLRNIAPDKSRYVNVNHK